MIMINDKVKKHLIKNINNKKIDNDLLLIIYFLLKDNTELDKILEKICEEKNINKSKYIEHLIKKEMNNNEVKS
jgi:hypothetical protein